VTHSVKQPLLERSFIVLATIIANFGDLISKKTSSIQQIIHNLADKGVIKAKNPACKATTFSKFFKELIDSVPLQRELICVRRNKEKEYEGFDPIFVHLGIKAKKNIEDIIGEGLAVAEVVEQSQKERHRKSADTIKRLWKRKGKKNLREVPSLESYLFLNNLRKDAMMKRCSEIEFYKKVFQGQNEVIRAYESAVDVSHFIKAIQQTSTLQNVLDLHFLLSKQHEIEVEFIQRIQKHLIHAMERQKDFEQFGETVEPRELSERLN